ncbi:DUF6443 domain-containing protein [Flavobacterium sp. DG1-102-2]|uniref:DUF6443 domain-containing protein n=1 Tax=Flavobacterium sp. DG1-102-2 TaxID=3081663 RepID=UPI002948C8AE|nr:DUF6443 domain-containing protein [Flavobacterium sp. DG1-102-2]MDV6167116.1 DUF6443 domain-containing protein [Flavobacterium sp. DG1-102-2]
MKKILYIFLLLPFTVLGQTTSQNYVRTYIYKDDTFTSDASKANATVTYYDGLGRPIQQVAGKMSNTGKDLVIPFYYDAFGRQSREYLPYEASITDLSFDGSAATNVVTFYNKTAFENTANPYTEKFFENSPLNRIRKQGFPGTDWLGNADNDNDHTIKYAYLANSSATPVKKLRAVAQWNPTNKVYNISIVDEGNYGDGQLYQTITQDENRAIPVQTAAGFKSGVEEFKDKEGRLILKKSYFQTNDYYGMPSSGTSNIYYVYDQYGNLTYVIPSGPITETTQSSLDLYGYQYKYDSRNRVVEKKLPGRDWEYIVYDNQDRVVATGPAYSPFGTTGNTQKGWLITKYDPFGRVAYTGWVAGSAFTSADRASKQAGTFGTETKTASATIIDNISVYYTNTYPQSGMKLLTVNYYDNYTFPAAATFPSSGVEGIGVLTAPKGMQTGSWNRILTTASETFAEVHTTFYDSKGRPLRVRTSNSQQGGYTQTDSKLKFDGSVSYVITKHKRTSSSSEQEVSVRNDYTYTTQDRLLSETHTIGTAAPELMSYNAYNSIGQLIEKKVGRTQSSPLQDVDFAYNIRGWLKSINSMANLASFGNPQDLFAFSINYTTASTDPVVPLNYNGNVTETTWKTSSDNISRKYSYKYDELARLRNAYYQIPAATVPMRNSYDESLRYDPYGNIIGLRRNGGLDSETDVVEIDNLVYTYTGNRLDKVVDNSNSSQGFNDLTAANVNDFGYDSLGNLTSDLNKGIAANGIIYNHMNLPVKITMNSVNGTGTISYIYNASGTKLRKTVVNTGISPSVTTVVDYLTGFQYKNNVLDFIPTNEGYVKNTVVNGTNNYNYVYNYKDHLGNVRLSYAVDPVDGVLKILEESHYYPFGMKHSGYNSTQNMISGFQTLPAVRLTPVNSPADMTYKYKFQGQERQDELGLSWDSFKWRDYDYTIGRFISIDPLAPDFPQWSPYVFSGNLVTISRELEGKEPEFLLGSDGKLSSGVVTLMNIAYGYSVSSLTNSTWIINTDARVRWWDSLTGHPNASVKGKQVLYSSDHVNSSADYWFGLISHEQSHRDEIDKEGNISFYYKYLLEGATKKYKDISTEAKAYLIGSDDDKVDLADKLLAYKDGAIMDIFQRGNLTDNEKAGMLKVVGYQFKRDVVLQGNINRAKLNIKNIKNNRWDSKTKSNMTNILNVLIKSWTIEQDEITNKYGE